jgi:hypothetical protein
VRFVQVTMGGWDHHGDIRGALPKTCAEIDRPCVVLIEDLKSRGLPDDTLVVWSGSRCLWRRGEEDIAVAFSTRLPFAEASSDPTFSSRATTEVSGVSSSMSEKTF